jgi:hypothetical protein
MRTHGQKIKELSVNDLLILELNALNVLIMHEKLGDDDIKKLHSESIGNMAGMCMMIAITHSDCCFPRYRDN